MSFKSIQSVETHEFYLELALSRARKRVKEYLAGLKARDKDKRAVMAEKLRFRVVKDTVNGSLGKVVSSFPSIDGLSEFYGELLSANFDVSRLRKALSSVDWACGKVSELSGLYSGKVAKASSARESAKIRDSFIGRVSSVLKRVNSHLAVLGDARKVFLSFPVVKEDCFTVCIIGFPNAGKSTLLSRLTSAKPEIGEYAFTTKGLNIGYFANKYKRVQVVDCPGTLARFDKMNYIEKQAYLAVKYLADLVVFVFDLTEEYPLDSQFRLLDSIKEFDKDLFFYISKTDILGKGVVSSFVESLNSKNVFLSPAPLREGLSSFMDKNYS